MEQQPGQPVQLEAFDLTPSPAAIHRANEFRMQQYIRSLPPEERYPRLVEPPIQRKTVPHNTRWVNLVNIVNR